MKRQIELHNLRQEDTRRAELDKVDFSKRRQKIQQAFNRTVQENARKEEYKADVRRRAMVRRSRQKAIAHPTDPPDAEERERQEYATANGDSGTPNEESTGAAELSEPNASRGIVLGDQATQSDSEATNLGSEDSPTLGQSGMDYWGESFNSNPQSSMDSSSFARRASSTSTTSSATNDTYVTTLDTDPPAESFQSPRSHRTLLNHIMQMRESSPSSPSSSDVPDYTYSDSDAPISLPDGTAYEGDDQEQQRIQGVPGRWSVSSWSSYVQREHPSVGQREDGKEKEARTRSPRSQSPSTRQPAGWQENGTPKDRGGMRLSFSSLARQGGWDTKRITQLYLEELARGRVHALGPMPATRTTPEVSWNIEAKKVDNSKTTENGGLESSQSGAVHDWEGASPSIADWMNGTVVAADESQQYDSERRGATPTPQASTELPSADNAEANGDVRESDNGASETSAEFPPAPKSSPPPPPSSRPSGDDYKPLSSMPGVHDESSSGLSEREQLRRTDSSENSSLWRAGPASSSLAHSSATSLLPPGSEQASLDMKRSSSPSPEQRRLKTRRHVIKELVDTEYTFGKDMKVVDDIYKGTSSSCLDLSTEDVKILFANSDQIVQFSVAFQDALRAASKSVYVIPKSQRWGSKRSSRKEQEPKKEEEPVDLLENSGMDRDRMTMIGQAFMAHIVQMEKVYADYLKNHDAANKKLQTLQHNPKVAIWLKECREWASDLTSAWDLDSLLVKPVQRILKYPLLLKQLLDLTPTDHPDHRAIADALEGVTNVSIRINEMKKRVDVVEQVVGRKRKESDVRAGLSKAIGRQTEKLRYQVGLSEALSFEDKNYDLLAQKFGHNFFELQEVKREVETYMREVQGSMSRFGDLVAVIERFLDVASSPAQYSEMETKWRRFRYSAQEIMTVLLSGHVSISRVTKA